MYWQREELELIPIVADEYAKIIDEFPEKLAKSLQRLFK
jgi:hypothetical protein